jgi:hypothetical protein
MKTENVLNSVDVLYNIIHPTELPLSGLKIYPQLTYAGSCKKLGLLEMFLFIGYDAVLHR